MKNRVEKVKQLFVDDYYFSFILDNLNNTVSLDDWVEYGKDFIEIVKQHYEEKVKEYNNELKKIDILFKKFSNNKYYINTQNNDILEVKDLTKDNLSLRVDFDLYKETYNSYVLVNNYKRLSEYKSHQYILYITSDDNLYLKEISEEEFKERKEKSVKALETNLNKLFFNDVKFIIEKVSDDDNFFKQTILLILLDHNIKNSDIEYIYIGYTSNGKNIRITIKFNDNIVGKYFNITNSKLTDRIKKIFNAEKVFNLQKQINNLTFVLTLKK